MADTVDVTMSHPYKDHNVGDRVAMDKDEARSVVQAGYGRYATKPDAKAAGDNPELAATAKP